MPGYHSLTGCTLATRLGAPVRLVGLTSAALCAGCLYFGTSLLALVPKWVVGTVLLYVGLGFLVEWLHQARLRLPRGDYAVLVLVFLGVVFVGLVEGIVLGVLAGVVLFVFNYSRVSVIRSIGSGTALRSNLVRPEPVRSLLRRHGGEIFVLKLQGYIFFATANRLLERVRARLADPHEPPLRCLILDFRQVSGLDSSTVISFAKLARHAEQGGFQVVLTGLDPAMATPLGQAGIGAGQHPAVHMFADLDRGLEWSEDQVLQARAETAAQLVDPLEAQLARVFPAAEQVARFMHYLERVSWPAGAALIEQGDRSDDLFFIEHGQVTVQLQIAERDPIRLRTMGPGTVVGEAAFYLGLPRSASVVADTETTAYRLTRGTLERMQQQAPALAALFHSFMARMLSERVIETTQLLETDLL
jgi:SulP family sulfate permease